jgi:AraC-like DNA-binding protein
MKCLALLLGFVFFQVQLSYSQSVDLQQKDFDSIFYATYLNIAATNPDRALEVADSLYRTSTTDIQKIRSLMLISDMHYRKSNRDSTVYYALKADKIASKAGITMWRARIYGVLSTQYRKSGLIKQGYEYLEKALEFSEMIEQQTVSTQLQGQIYQEKGYYAQEENDIENAIRFFRASDTILLNLPDSPHKATFRAQSNERIGANYLKLQMLDSAKLHYITALELENIASEEETVMKGFIYKGLGEIAISNNNEKDAFEFLSKAKEIAESSNFLELRTAVYFAMMEFYKFIGDIENYTFYNEKYLDIINIKSKKDREYANKVVAKADKKLEQALFSRNAVSVILVVLVLLVIVLGMFYFMRKRKKESATQQEAVQENKATSEDLSSKEYIPKETMDRILRELEALEQQDFFLQSDVTLSVLASKLNVNSRYVSYVINNLKGVGFNSYINEIRVNRSIADLKKNPELWTYKIAYLAEKYGFSSHSKYTAAFRAVTGITPSLYITGLQSSAVRDSIQEHTQRRS